MGAFANQNNPPVLKAQEATFAQVLSGYDIELIVDQSVSMENVDCPGGMTRWNWCGKQAKDLARQLAPFVQQGFTLTTFNKEYQVYRNASPKNIE